MDAASGQLMAALDLTSEGVSGSSVPVPWRDRAFAAGRSAPVRYPLGVVALAALYYGAAHLGYAFQFAGPVAAIVWLPAGVGIAFLYLAGLGFWPGVLVGDLLVNDYSALPVGSAVGQTCGNVLEVVVAAALIRALIPRGSPLSGASALGRLLVAIAAGTALSATVGALSLRLGHVITNGEAPAVWRTWWLGDSAGALIIVPLALAWARPPARRWLTERALEGALMLLAAGGLSALALHSHTPLTYLVFPALIWAALRFGQWGATLAITIVVGFTLWNTTHYVGPFVFHSITHTILNTQLFVIVTAISTLSLAAVVSERETLAGRLKTSRVRLVKAGDAERRRLEHNLHDGAQQRLTALLVRLGIASEQVRETPERAPAMLAAAEAELGLAIEDLRELAHGIHPALLTRYGLARALQDVAARSTVPIELVELPSLRLEQTTEATAFYVVAEAVTNAHRYAGASAISVRAAVAGRTLYVEVVDDGAGGASENAGSGLRGLRDRVEASGGAFHVDSPAGRGTRVAAALPAITPRPR